MFQEYPYAPCTEYLPTFALVQNHPVSFVGFYTPAPW